MPRKRSDGEKVKQDYKFLGVLYPDSDSYDYFKVLDAIKSYFGRWAVCVHDQDKDEATGELKKTHVHWVGRVVTEEGKNSYVPLSSVAHALGIAENYIEFAKSEKSAIRYLIHADDDDKYQYSVSCIESNYSLIKYFRDKAANMKSKKIYEFIVENRPSSVNACMWWIFQNDCYAEFRRGFAIWDSLIRELKKDEYS